jgi:hypothetical protein
MIDFIPTILLADFNIINEVQDRIKPVGTNQGERLPYIVFQTVSNVPERCREGIAVETVRVQVTVIAATYAQTQELYMAVRNALDTRSDHRLYCQWESAQDLYREEGSAHGKAIDFQLITR